MAAYKVLFKASVEKERLHYNTQERFEEDPQGY
jgi:hypothetical protein